MARLDNYGKICFTVKSPPQWLQKLHSVLLFIFVKKTMWLLWHSPIKESGEYSKLVRGTLRVSTLGKQWSAKRDTNDFWLVDKIVVRVCKQSMSKTNATAISMYFKPQHYHLLQSQNRRVISTFSSRKSTEGYPCRNGTGSEENLRVRFLEGYLYGKASLWLFCVISRDIRGFTCSLQQFLGTYWLILLDNQLYEKQSWFTSFCLSSIKIAYRSASWSG